MKTMNIMKMMMTGLAALLLAGVTEVRAQQAYYQIVLTNNYFVTPYNNTNQIVNTNQEAYTLTNPAAVSYAGSNGVPVSLRACQNVPVGLFLETLPNATAGIGAAPSNTVAGIDLSPDNVTWFSNQLTVTCSQTPGVTNIGGITLPLVNGTNAFTGMAWARWGYATTQASNPIVSKFWLQIYR